MGEMLTNYYYELLFNNRLLGLGKLLAWCLSSAWA